MAEICCIFNLAPHYRYPIYKLMDKELNCHFYFGNEVDSDIKTFKPELLKGYQRTLKRISFGKWRYSWLTGSLKPIFKPYKYYIISGGHKYLSHWLLLFVAKISNKKVFIWGHGLKGKEKRYGKKLKKAYYNLAHAVLLYGNWSKKVMLNEGFPEKKLIPIFNSLDYESQLSLRDENLKSNIFKIHFGNDSPVLIYIGRIQKSKHLEKLVEIQKNLSKKNKDYNLVFVGKDLGDNEVRETVNRMNLKNKVWFYGPCYDEKKIGELLSSANLLVSPGSIGLTALHASAYGIPMITHDDFKSQMPEFEIIKSGVNGSFYKLGDDNDLENKIEEWLFIGDKKKETAKKFSWGMLDEIYNPFYQINVLKTVTCKK